MKHTKTIALLTGLGLSGQVYWAQAASIKCWTNDAGIRECGSVVPPQYAKQGHEVLDSRGSVVQTVEAQKSEEELEALRQAEEAQRLAEEERKRQEDEDRKLIDTYPTENDIVTAKESKQASIDASIALASRQLDFSRQMLTDVDKELERIAQRLQTLASSRDKAKLKEVEDRKKELENHAADLRGKIQRSEEQIAEKHADKVKAEEEFANYLARHRVIKQAQVKQRLQQQSGAVPGGAAPANPGK